jgi:hypothetical protein
MTENAATCSRGYVAEDENGVLGVAVDFFRGRWTGFRLDDPRTGWSSAAPRRWLGPVVPFLRKRIPGR